MSSLALDVFHRLIEQVDKVEAVAAESESDDSPLVASVLRRSAFVLAVAAADTYFHEQSARLLFTAAKRSPADAQRVAAYLGRTSATDASGPSGENHIRLGLSYKTLASPSAIDGALVAGGLSAEAVWLNASFTLGTRPDRLKMQMQLFYDRRNQIAHEGDWDRIQLDFRHMQQAHLGDCVTFLRRLAEAVDPLIGERPSD